MFVTRNSSLLMRGGMEDLPGTPLLSSRSNRSVDVRSLRTIGLRTSRGTETTSINVILLAFDNDTRLGIPLQKKWFDVTVRGVLRIATTA
ncbi:hypothetical protein ZOD2009_15966 [Haladaptatus paucihalophilus DX253]|uniref:Uncharacterized protein n=1 Tax=Haladaptatus paucihalophilus DX253 TaxID=797209 RepID=E7QWK5_HALPU|nr:hypothetical protein ZOD2009_15966 [Haladaptatus paucihalophilus DX253]